ncbi:hypothetical protein K1719_040638 [Acacia pycnantha]|nr:hypothetical protein K1719_040638 [Acacia pycnantha]
MEGGRDKTKVMVGIDESECSRYALEWPLQNLSHTLSGSELIIFSAQPIDHFSYGYAYASSFGAASPKLIQSLRDNQRNLTLALLQKAKQICAQRGIDAETLTETGNPKEAICEAVEKLKVQLLVLGSHGRGALQRAFLGSVSSYCVQHAKCPVIVVKNKAS